MNSTRIAVVVGLVCGATIYEIVPRPTELDNASIPAVAAKTLSRFDPAIAHVHGCTTIGHELGSYGYVDLYAENRFVDRTYGDTVGCFDVEVDRDHLGRIELSIATEGGEPIHQALRVGPGEHLELGNIEVGTHIVSGTVRDRWGAPLAGVRVSAADHVAYTHTNHAGHYVLQLPEGPNTLEVEVYGEREVVARPLAEPAVVDVTFKPQTRDLILR